MRKPPLAVPAYRPDIYTTDAIVDPYPHYARLRELGPVVWLSKHRVYALPRFAECKAVLRDDATFVSGHGVALNPIANRLSRGTTLNSDGAEHDQRRKLLAHRMLPRALRAISDSVDVAEFKVRQAERWGWDPDEPLDMIYRDRPDHADFRMLSVPSFTRGAMARLEGELAELRPTFVGASSRSPGSRATAATGVTAGRRRVNLSLGVPLATICRIMGVPTSDWTDIVRWTDGLMFPAAADVPARRDAARDARRRLGREYKEYLDTLIADRRRHPGDDLASALVHATIDGVPLTDQQLHGYFVLIIAAGNETTRNAITGGVHALLHHPDQRDRLAADPAGMVETAAEEILRWTSPVVQFARTATTGLRAERDDDPRRRHGDAVVPVGQPRRAPVRRSVHVRHRPPSEPAPRVRLRRALLPRRQPRPLGAARRVPRAGPAPRRAGAGRPAAPPPRPARAGDPRVHGALA